jgi:UDP-N-acetylmuramoylalanine--D-glutamate ligase
MPLVVPEFLKPAFAHPVAIFGGGVSGAGICALLAELGVHGRIYDVMAGRGAEFTAAAARQHALVVFSPGFPPEHPWLERARAAGVMCLGELDFASQFWRGNLIAVTGTNGKTTLTEFLTHALGVAGRDAHATGNIGYSLSRLVAEKGGGVKDSIAVCEVSSFQAETLEHFRADATLWTNFAEDHLERHPGIESYFGAKWKLVTHTDPGAIFAGNSVQRYARKFDRPITALVAVPTEDQPEEARLAGTVFAAYPQRENFLLAAAWWKANGHAEATLLAAARSFKLGRHRLARVGEHEGVTYWNDSKATNFHAVEAALAGFTAPVVLIAGGKSKGGDLAGFVHRIAPRVKHAVLIGETSTELAFHCAAFRVAHSTCASLAEAVRRAAELAAAGDQILLSPGFASFDMFRNYEDRGDQFEALVQSAVGQNVASATSLR